MTISLSDNAKVVMDKRYLNKDATGRIVETPEKLLWRVAGSVAEADREFDDQADVKKTADRFYNVMSRKWFLPNSPTLMNAGLQLGQLAACFVLPINDSMDSIFETLKHTAMIHKSGGGTGFSFSKIRPQNDIVRSTAGVSSGPLSFMTVFDAATETVKQGGRRRGANMAMLRVDHPDIEDFIMTKRDPGNLNNFNISVAVTRAFMMALEKDGEYQLINPRTGQSVGSASASRVFDMIIDASWHNGEPGVIYIDTMNQQNPTPHLGDFEATNPCGEQPLLPYESCTLGSVNLSKMVTRDDIDFKRLKSTVHTAVHFLDNVIEVNKYPLDRIETMSKKTRKIGLGVMGFADMLIMLGVAYDSRESVALAEKVMRYIADEAKSASAGLASKRGNFPAYQGSIYDRFEMRHMRNATTTTIAPTGSISIIAGASSGIEPIFAVVHERRILDGRRLKEIHPLFVKAARRDKFYSKELMAEIGRRGSLQTIKEVPPSIKRLFKTSHDISAEWHVRVQAAFQKYTDNAVSKTVNFPKDATREDIRKVYRLAYQSGCKGVTIFRDGSRQQQVLSVEDKGAERAQVVPRPRPIRTQGVTERIQTGCGKLYVTVNSDEKGICEVFAQMGKTGGCASSQIESAGRLISLALRSGVRAEAIIKQLVGIRCPTPVWQNGQAVLSCADAIAQILKKFTDSDIEDAQPMLGVCPDCSSVLSHEEGCLVCRACGFSRCT